MRPRRRADRRAARVCGGNEGVLARSYNCERRYRLISEKPDALSGHCSVGAGRSTTLPPVSRFVLSEETTADLTALLAATNARSELLSADKRYRRAAIT